MFPDKDLRVENEDMMPPRLTPSGKEKKGKRKFLRYLIPLVILGGFSYAVWGLYQDKATNKSGEIPILRASEDPVKIKPESPGGTQIPYQDKLVLNQYDQDAATEVENLLPPPEEAVDLPEPSPEDGFKEIVVPPSSQFEPVQTGGEMLVDEEPEKEVAEIDPAPTPAAKPAPTPVKEEVKEAAKPAENRPAQKPKKVEGGQIWVQLAALRSVDRAKEEGKALQKKFANQLGDLEIYIHSVDLGSGKGVFHRLQFGPMTDRGLAGKICEELQAQKQGCMIVKR